MDEEIGKSEKMWKYYIPQTFAIKDLVKCIDHDLVSNSDDLYIAFNLEKVTDYIQLHNFSQVSNGQNEHKSEEESSEEEFKPASNGNDPQSSINNSNAQHNAHC